MVEPGGGSPPRPPQRPSADPAALVEVLNAHQVEYLVLGGLAVITHGYPRLTLDLDILPSPDAANCARLADALRELEAHALGARGERIDLDLSRPEALAVGVYLLTTRHGALDLVNGDRPSLIRYRRLSAASVAATIGGHQVRVISKDDLIAMKREAGRPKDLADIAALTEVERSRDSGD